MEVFEGKTNKQGRGIRNVVGGATSSCVRKHHPLGGFKQRPAGSESCGWRTGTIQGKGAASAKALRKDQQGGRHGWKSRPGLGQRDGKVVGA